jgi:hypothetical protein
VLAAGSDDAQVGASREHGREMLSGVASGYDAHVPLPALLCSRSRSEEPPCVPHRLTQILDKSQCVYLLYKVTI